MLASPQASFRSNTKWTNSARTMWPKEPCVGNASTVTGRRSHERHDSRMSDSGGSHESMEDIERDG